MKSIYIMRHIKALLNITLLVTLALVNAPVRADYYYYVAPEDDVNEYVASLGVSGLTVQKNKHVQMMEEILKIDFSLVDVTYIYKNHSNKVQKLLMGFPLPAYSQCQPKIRYDLWQLPDFNFRTTINGKVVGDWKTHKVSSFDTDTLTEVGKELNLPENWWKAGFCKAWRRKNEISLELVRKIIQYTGGESEINGSPFFTILREQTFQPKETVIVRHRYKPITGGQNHFRAYDMMQLIKLNGKMRRSSNFSDTLDFREAIGCKNKPHDTLDNALAEYEQLPRDDGWYGWDAFRLRYLSYILKTGKNWAGPIKKFRLEIGLPMGSEHPTHINILYHCIDGLERQPDGRYVLEAEDYIPTQNLHFKFATIPIRSRDPNDNPMWHDAIIDDNKGWFGTSYFAHIADEDYFNSKGQKLTSLWQILQQDRANFRQFSGQVGDTSEEGSSSQWINWHSSRNTIVYSKQARKALESGETGITLLVTRVVREKAGNENIYVNVQY